MGYVPSLLGYVGQRPSGRVRDAVALFQPGLSGGRPFVSILLTPLDLAQRGDDVRPSALHTDEGPVEEGSALLLGQGSHLPDQVGADVLGESLRHRGKNGRPDVHIFDIRSAPERSGPHGGGGDPAVRLDRGSPGTLERRTGHRAGETGGSGGVPGPTDPSPALGCGARTHRSMGEQSRVGRSGELPRRSVRLQDSSTHARLLRVSRTSVREPPSSAGHAFHGQWSSTIVQFHSR